MKKLILCLFLVSFSFTTFAVIPAVQSCLEFDQIQRMRKDLDGLDSIKIVDVNQWVDSRLKRDERKANAMNVAKVGLLAFIRRVNWTTFYFMPSKLGSGTMIAGYIKNAKAYERFLDLTLKQACQYFNYPADEEVILLRDITHEVWREMKSVDDLF